MAFQKLVVTIIDFDFNIDYKYVIMMQWQLEQKEKWPQVKCKCLLYFIYDAIETIGAMSNYPLSRTNYKSVN